jgi:hypothetical protein
MFKKETLLKGDTILFISEIKEEYMDPNLVQNTKNQMDAKTIANPMVQKNFTLTGQIQAIENEKF